MTRESSRQKIIDVRVIVLGDYGDAVLQGWPSAATFDLYGHQRYP